MWSLLLALGLAGGLVVSASVAAKADDSVTNLIGSFGECAKTNKSANVLLLIDQSSSLSGDGGSDPDNVRRQAATDFVGQLASYASKNNIDVSVMASGFHGNYTPGSWAKVGSADGEKQELQDVEQVANESSGQETDYWNALEGARKDLAAAPSPCDLVVWFTDGEYLVEGTAYGDTKPYSDKNASSDSAGVIQDGKDSICSALQGPMNGMRANGVYVVAVGLNKDSAHNMDFLKKAALGTDCGAAPQANHAAYVPVTDASELVFALGSLTSTTLTTDAWAKGSAHLDFGLDSYITSASVLADAGASVAGLQFGLQAPGVPDANIAWASPKGGALQVAAADVVATPVGDRAMRFDITRKGAGTGYEGTWMVRLRVPKAQDIPAGTFAQASISVVGDLQLAWVNKTDKAKVGGDLPVQVKVVHKDGKPVATSPPQANVEVSYDAGANGVTRLKQGSLADFVKGTTVALKTKDGKPLAPGDGKLVLTLKVVTTAKPPTKLDPAVSTYPLTIITPVNYPVVSQTPLVLKGEQGAEAEGVAPSTGQIAVTGPGCVWVDTAASIKDIKALPAGVDDVALTTTATNKDSCVKLEAGKQTTLPVAVVPKTQGNGAVAGAVVVNAAPDAADKAPMVVTVPFSAERIKAANGGTKWLTFLLAMLLGLGLPMALLMAVRARSAVMRVSGNDVGDLAYARKQLRISGSEVVDAGTGQPMTLGRDDIRTAPTDAESVTQLAIEDITFTAQKWGNPFAMATVKVRGTQGPVITDEAPTVSLKDGGSQLPLSVQGHWVAQAVDAQTVSVLMLFSNEDTIPARIDALTERLNGSLNANSAALEQLLQTTVGAATPDGFAAPDEDEWSTSSGPAQPDEWSGDEWGTHGAAAGSVGTVAAPPAAPPTGEYSAPPAPGQTHSGSSSGAGQQAPAPPPQSEDDDW